MPIRRIEIKAHFYQLFSPTKLRLLKPTSISAAAVTSHAESHLNSHSPHPDRTPIHFAHTLSRLGSNQTSSCPGATRKRQPGPNPKYFTISGHRSFKWKVCSGTKNPSSVENSSPDQIYHPVVSPSGGWRRPFIGNCVGSKVLLMPIFDRSSDRRKEAPNLRHILRCSFGNEGIYKCSRIRVPIDPS